MRQKKQRLSGLKWSLAFILLLLISFALQYLGRLYPETVEYAYSRSIYRIISLPVSRYFSIFPFSAAEIMVYAVSVFALFLLIQSIIYICKHKFRLLLHVVLTIVCLGITGYFLFVVIWGLNYDRLPLEKNLGYKTGTTTVKELTALMQSETDAINKLCPAVSYDSKGHSYYAGGFNKMKSTVNAGYQKLAAQSKLQDTLFGGNRPYPKGVLASKLMAYTGIAGIYVPFTCEPNVNADNPEFDLPFNAAHESAHFKGFAREEEANFVAYLADTSNPDKYFQYSAHMEAYIYLSDALYSTDNSAWKGIAKKLNKRAVNDFVYYNEYLQAHQSKAQDVSNKINDNYLKSQGQQGVISYDMFVNLLADKYRTEHE